MPPKRRHQEQEAAVHEEEGREEEGEAGSEEGEKGSKRPKTQTTGGANSSSSGATSSTSGAGAGGEESWAQLLARAAGGSAIVLPPLTDPDIDHFEREYEQAFGLADRSIRLPAALRELYRTFGGLNVTGDDLWIFGFNLLPLRSSSDSPNAQKARSVRQYREDIEALLEDLGELQDDEDEEEEEKVDDDSVRRPTWLPFAVIDEYYNFFINASAASRHQGLVKMVVLNDPSESVAAPDLETFWRTLVDVFIRTVIAHKKLEAAGREPQCICFQTFRETAESVLRTLQAQLDQLEPPRG